MKVRAKNEEIRNVLFHPIGGRFREDGTAEWPDDAYTFRRINDGDVTAEESEQHAQEPSAQEPPPKKSKSTKEA